MKLKIIPTLLTIALAPFTLIAQEDSIWNRLNEDVQFALRFSHNEDALERSKELFPQLTEFYTNLPRQLFDTFMHNEGNRGEGDPDLKKFAEEFQSRYGFTIEELVTDLDGEVGFAGYVEFPESEDEEPAPRLMLWFSPKTGTASLYSRIRTILDVEAREASFSIEEVNLGAHQSLYINSVNMVESQSWPPNSLEPITETYFSNETVLITAHPQHILVEFQFHPDEYDTETDAFAARPFSQEDFVFSGETLSGSPSYGFARRFTENPTSTAGVRLATFIDAAIHLKAFNEALQNFINFQRAEFESMAGSPFGPPPVILELLKVDLLGLIGSTGIETIHLQTGISSEGSETLIGLGGRVARSPSIIQLLLSPPEGGFATPHWVPSSAVGVSMDSIPLTKVYQLINTRLTNELGELWTNTTAELEEDIAEMGLTIDGIFSLFGEKVYSIEGPILPVTAGSEGVSRIQDSVYVSEIQNVEEFNKAFFVMQAMVPQFFGREIQITPIQQQGFSGFSLGSEGSPMPARILHNERFLVVAIGEALGNEVIAGLANPDQQSGGFFQKPAIVQFFESRDISSLSSLNVYDAAKLMEGVESMIGSSSSGGNMFSAMMFELPIIAELLKAIPWKAYQDELGLSFNTGELKDNGFLLRMIQTPKRP